MTQLSHPTYGLHPSEDLFHSLALLLTDPITSMPRRPSVNRAVYFLRHVRSSIHLPALGSELFGVIPLVATHRNFICPFQGPDHHQGRFPLRGSSNR